MASEEQLPEREQRVVQMLRQAAATERAPMALRAEVESLRAQSRGRAGAGPARRRPAWATPGGRLRIGMVTVMPLAAALAVALVLVLGGGSSISPPVAQAAGLATRGAVTAAPGTDPTAPRLLTARVEGLHFPNWQAQGGWKSTGMRVDQVDSQAVTTVYYRHAGTQIAYSIIARPALRGSSPQAGQHYRTFERSGRTYIVWTESGHTCLLSSTGVSSDRLWALVRGQTV